MPKTKSAKKPVVKDETLWPSKPFPKLADRVFTITIPGWRPASLNECKAYGGVWWTEYKLKARDKRVIKAQVTPDMLIDPSRPVKRRVTICILLGARQKRGDVDAYYKSTLDALSHCGVLFDDADVWCEIKPTIYIELTPRPKLPTTELIIEDL